MLGWPGDGKSRMLNPPYIACRVNFEAGSIRSDTVGISLISARWASCARITAG